MSQISLDFNASLSWLLIFYIDLSIPTISELITSQISYCLRVGSIFSVFD